MISNCCANCVPRAWTTNLSRPLKLCVRCRFSAARHPRAVFSNKTHAALAHLDWKQHALELANVARDWSQHLDAKFSRALFLRWLEERLRRQMPPAQPQATIRMRALQLLHGGARANQEWSHLILAAGTKARGRRLPARSSHAAQEIHAFNRSVQQLNKRAARQGSQGEGHTSVRENHSLYPGRASNARSRCGNSMHSSNRPAKE